MPREDESQTFHRFLACAMCAILLHVGNWRRGTQWEGKDTYAQTGTVHAYLVRRLSRV